MKLAVVASVLICTLVAMIKVMITDFWFFLYWIVIPCVVIIGIALLIAWIKTRDYSSINARVQRFISKFKIK